MEKLKNDTARKVNEASTSIKGYDAKPVTRNRPSCQGTLSTMLWDHPQWFICCRPAQDLVQSGFEGSEVCFRAIHGQCCAINLVNALNSRQDSLTLV